jgi:predicted kinase
MKRRAKRGVNDSESTGKIGQEIPVDQPAPLQPMYPEDQRKRASESAAAVEPIVNEEPEPFEAAPPDGEETAPVDIPEPAIAERKLVVETQPESPSIPPPELPSAQKDLKGYVVLAIGLPGSGKTTWFKRRGVTPLSSDMLRTILFDDITEQRYQGLVFSTLRSLLRARLIAKMPWNYVDATNLSAHERRQWIKMAKSFGYEAQAVFFDVPLEVCMERNSRRERTVSDEVMRKMAERLRPPSFKEGFSKITMVRVKGAPPVKLDGVEPEPPGS